MAQIPGLKKQKAFYANKPEKVLVGITGNGYLCYGLATCMYQAGHPVILCTENVELAKEAIRAHLSDIQREQSMDDDSSFSSSSNFAHVHSDVRSDTMKADSNGYQNGSRHVERNSVLSDFFPKDKGDGQLAKSAGPKTVADLKRNNGQAVHSATFDAECPIQIVEDLSFLQDVQLVIAVTDDDVVQKKSMIDQLELLVGQNTILAINMEAIALDSIQSGTKHPERILGLNWTEPVHTTRFLEMVINKQVSEPVRSAIENWATKYWNKKHYVVENEGIRSRLMSAMIREAFFLVENGFASIEDIDRACRNDAGYYLPFAGNLRYMDLMGTYAYGMVMKDLNPHLSKKQTLPAFFEKILAQNGKGLKNGIGLYHYNIQERDKWRSIFAEFSFKIEAIIDKYPFHYKEGEDNDHV